MGGGRPMFPLLKARAAGRRFSPCATRRRRVRARNRNDAVGAPRSWLFFNRGAHRPRDVFSCEGHAGGVMAAALANLAAQIARRISFSSGS